MLRCAASACGERNEKEEEEKRAKREPRGFWEQEGAKRTRTAEIKEPRNANLPYYFRWEGLVGSRLRYALHTAIPTSTFFVFAS